MMARKSADPTGEVLRNEVLSPKGNSKYKDDLIFRAKWDTLQERLRCCGWGKSGYRDYISLAFSEGHDASCLPDSCKINKDDDSKVKFNNARQLVCTHKANDNKIMLCGKVWTQGCISILSMQYGNELDKGKKLKQNC